jgi:hypothetical protein
MRHETGTSPLGVGEVAALPSAADRLASPLRPSGSASGAPANLLSGPGPRDFQH